MQGFRLNVLNPGGHDPDQSFADGVPQPSRRQHAPVNYHAYAACSGGCFLRSVQAASESDSPVLLLLRRDLRRSLDALEQLKAAGRTVAVTFKETGIHQTHQALASRQGMSLLRRIATLCDGFLTPVPWLVPVFEAFAKEPTHVLYLPTPYPVDEPGWDFSIPLSVRQGIFVGTRELGVPTRRHGPALIAAASLAASIGSPLGVFNTDGPKGERLLRDLAAATHAEIMIYHKHLAYEDYLRVMRRYRIVFQMDASQVPGQVAGDALLCRMPCVGGNGTVESIAFPDFSGDQSAATLSDYAQKLLLDDSAWENTVAISQKIARDSLAFSQAAEQLKTFFEMLATRR